MKSRFVSGFAAVRVAPTAAFVVIAFVPFRVNVPLPSALLSQTDILAGAVSFRMTMSSKPSPFTSPTNIGFDSVVTVGPTGVRAVVKVPFPLLRATKMLITGVEGNPVSTSMAVPGGLPAPLKLPTTPGKVE
jgi:hypothetical protein